MPLATTAAIIIIGIAFVTQTARAHMPMFVDHTTCRFDDEASTQSMAIYTKVPAGAVLRCSFVVNDENEELQLSLSMPISHYDVLVADGLLFSMYASGAPEWSPQCMVGWDAWHKDGSGSEGGGGGGGSDNKNAVVPLQPAAAARVPLSQSASNRVAVFEPWGVGGYIPITACSTPIAYKGGRHYFLINNTNDREVRVCVGVGTKEEHFQSLGAWIELKWSFSLWRTWEWGMTYAAFVTVASFATLSNLYILLLMMYGVKPHWFYWPLTVLTYLSCCLKKRDRGDGNDGGDGNARYEGDFYEHDASLYTDPDDAGFDFERILDDGEDGDAGTTTTKSDTRTYAVPPDWDTEDVAVSDGVVNVGGFIVIFWVSGVCVVWLLVFFINYTNTSAVYTAEGTRAKLIRWDNVWSPLLYVYTLPVIVIAALYIAVRYSSLWTWFWLHSVRWNGRVILLFLIFDIIIATIFDLIYPFSYLSVLACLYCTLVYLQFFYSNRRFCPTIPAWRAVPNDHSNIKKGRRSPRDKGGDVKFETIPRRDKANISKGDKGGRGGGGGGDRNPNRTFIFTTISSSSKPPITTRGASIASGCGGGGGGGKKWTL